MHAHMLKIAHIAFFYDCELTKYLLNAQSKELIKHSKPGLQNNITSANVHVHVILYPTN